MAKTFLEVPSREVSITDITGSDNKISPVKQQLGSSKQGGNTPIDVSSVIGGNAPFVQQGTVKSYERVLGKGNYHPEVGATEVASRMHNQQSVGSMVANYTGQFATAVLGGAIEGFGNIADLNAGAELAEGSKLQFGNTLSRLGAEIQESGRTNMPIYMDPYKEGKFDPGSASWWLTNFTSLASSLALLAPTIAATALTKNAGPTIKTLATSTISRAAMSRQAEGLMEARGTYEDVFNTYKEQGYNLEDAAQHASLAAANTYNKNWLLLAQDIPQFKLFDKLVKLKSASAVDLGVKKSLNSWFGHSNAGVYAGQAGAMALDMLGEATEEGIQFAINKQSTAIGEQAISGVSDDSLLSTFGESVKEGEFWTNAFFGAMGSGIMQTGMTALTSKAVKQSIRQAIEPVTKLATVIEQAKQMADASMESDDYLDKQLAYAYGLTNLAAAGNVNGLTEHQSQMFDAIFNPESQEDDTLLTKWGLNPDNIQAYRSDASLQEQVRNDFKAINAAINNQYEKNKKSVGPNGKFKTDQEAKQHAQNYGYYTTLLNKLDNIAKEHQTSIEDLYVNKLSSLADNTGRLLLSDVGQDIVSNNAIINHHTKRLAGIETKLNAPDITKKDKKILERSKAFVETKLAEAKAKTEELKKGYKDLAPILRGDGSTEISQEAYDNELLATIDANDLNTLIAMQSRLEGLKEALNATAIRKAELDKLAFSEFVGEDKQPTNSDIKSDILEQDERGIALGDIITRGADQYRIVGLRDINNEQVDINTREAINDYARAGLQLVLDKIDPATGKSTGEERTMMAANEVEAGSLIKQQGLIDIAEDFNIARDEVTTTSTEKDPLAEAINTSNETVGTHNPVSHVQYCHWDNGVLVPNKGAEEFAKVISNKKTNLQTASAKLFLLEEASQSYYKEKILAVVSGIKLTTEQTKLLEKFYAKGERLSANEIDILFGTKKGDISTIPIIEQTLVDYLPIRVGLTISGTTYKDGMFLPATPKVTEKNNKGKKVTESIRRATRENRYALIKTLMEKSANNPTTVIPAYDRNIKIQRNRGNILVAPKGQANRNRKLTQVFGDKVLDWQLGISKPRASGDNNVFISSTEKVSSSSNIATTGSIGNVYLNMPASETLNTNGNTTLIKLNKPKVSKEFARLVFDMYSVMASNLARSSKEGSPAISANSLRFPKDDTRLVYPVGSKEQLTVGRFLEAFVVSSNLRTGTTRNLLLKKYKNNPVEFRAAANKYLKLVEEIIPNGRQSFKGYILEYGVREIDETATEVKSFSPNRILLYTDSETDYVDHLNDQEYLEQKADFIDWMARNKSYAVHLDSHPINAKLNSNEPFLNGVAFELYEETETGRAEKPYISYDGKGTYKDFLINNGLVQTDVVLNESGSAFEYPIIDLNLAKAVTGQLRKFDTAVEQSKVDAVLENIKPADSAQPVIKNKQRKSAGLSSGDDEVFADITPVVDQTINYTFKAVNILLSDKGKQVFEKGKKNNWSLDKILTELAIPKEQKILFEEVWLNVLNKGRVGMPTQSELLDEAILDFISKYSYTVEINTAKTNEDKQVKQIGDNEEFTFNGSIYEYINGEYLKDNDIIDLIEYESAKHEAFTQPNTQHYSNLTVPGGTNYTENEISTPLITPSIKGHAQFSTDKGIGWFRSDDKQDSVLQWGVYTPENELLASFKTEQEAREFNNKRKDKGWNQVAYVDTNVKETKTRRILELQSDLFQKGRDNKYLTGSVITGPIQVTSETILQKIKNEVQRLENESDLPFGIGNIVTVEGREYERIDGKWYRRVSNEYNGNIRQNDFLQLLNKDSNWVTFFIKSIIQDSAKKGYEKVLFPKGETAAKVEGHQTIADEINSKNIEIERLKKDILNYDIIDNKTTVDNLQWRIDKLEQEKADLKSQGIEKLKPIEAFYEIKVGNILEKQFGKDNVKTITDEYGNQWREITIDTSRDFEQILFANTTNNTVSFQNPKLSSTIDWAFNTIGISKDEWDIRERLTDLVYQGKDNFALYSHDAILLWQGSDDKVIYHEAFHRVSLGYLTSKEREVLYRSARVRYSMPKEQYTDKEVEERLADEFMNYVSTRGEQKPMNAIERFFMKLKQFIKRLFVGKNRLKPYDIDVLFNSISNGYFAKSSVLKENQNNIKPGEYQKTLVGSTYVDSLNSRKELHDLTKALAAMLFKVSGVSSIEDAKNLRVDLLTTYINDGILADNEAILNNPDDYDLYERAIATNTVNLLKEILGERAKEGEKSHSGFIGFDNFMLPQLNSYLSTLGINPAKHQRDITPLPQKNAGDIDANEENQTDVALSGKTGTAYQRAPYEFNRSESIRANVKYMVGSLHEYVFDETSGKYQKKESRWGGEVFVDFPVIWHKLINLLYDCSNIEEMIQRLEDTGELTKDYTLLQLADRLTKAKVITRRQFFVALRAAKLNFIAAEARLASKNDNSYTVSITDVAEETAKWGLITNWTDKLFNDPNMYHRDPEDNKPRFIYGGEHGFEAAYSYFVENVDATTVGLLKHKDTITEADVARVKNNFITALKKFHIDVDLETVAYYTDRILINKSKNESSIVADLEDFDSMAEMVRTNLRFLKDAAEDEKLVSKYEFGYQKRDKILGLAEAYATVHPETLDDSQLGPNKDIYFTFTNTSHTTDTFLKLKKNKDLVQSLANAEGFKHSRLLNTILENPAASEDIKLRQFSYLRVNEAKDREDGRGYFELTPAEDLLFNYSAFFRKDKNDRHTPLLAMPSSPRTSAYYLEGLPIFKQVIKNITIASDGAKIMQFSDEVYDYFYGAYLDEVDRVNNAWKLIKKYLDANESEREKLKSQLIINYHVIQKKDGSLDFANANGLRLQHFAGIQDLPTELPLKSNNYLKAHDFAAFKDLIRPYFVSRVMENVQHALDNEVFTFLDDDIVNNNLPNNTFNKYKSLGNDNAPIAAMADYTMNTMMGILESEKVIGMYPGLFKYDSATGNSLGDAYKRWYGPGSSGDHYNEVTESDPSTTYSVAVGATQKFSSKELYDSYLKTHTELIAEQLAAAYNEEIKLKERSYNHMSEDNPKRETLLVEINTLRSKATEAAINASAKNLAETRLQAYTKIDPTDGGSVITVSMYKKLLDREGLLTTELSEAIDYMEAGDYSNKGLLAKYSKLVAFTPQKTMHFGMVFENGTAHVVYDKMSMGVLFKGLVTGTPLEDLYNRLNAIGKYEGLPKIDQYIFDSAIKVGNRLGTAYFANGSQMEASNDLSNMPIYDRNWADLRKQQKIEAHGDYSGQSLGSAVFKIAAANLNESADYTPDLKGIDIRRNLHASRAAISNVGVHMVQALYGLDGNQVDTDTFTRRLRLDAMSAQKDDDFINAFGVDPIDGSMKVALDALPDRGFIYNRITKVIKKLTVDLVTPGAQLVQLSSWGLRSQTGSGLLKMQTYDETSETLTKMECMVSTRLFAHLIPNYDEISHEERVKILENLAPTLLGYRTPTQGQNSVMSLQIVKFLPHEASDTIFLPLEFTALTGSDFDIDKLFISFREYTINENSKISAVEYIAGDGQDAIDKRYTAKAEELWNIYKKDTSRISAKDRARLSSKSDSLVAISSDLIDSFSGSEDEVAELQNLYKQYQFIIYLHNKEKLSDNDFAKDLSSVRDAILEFFPYTAKVQSDKKLLSERIKLLQALKLLPDKATFANLSEEEQNTRAANVNRILDLYDVVLTSRQHLTSTTRPLDSTKAVVKTWADKVIEAERGYELPTNEPLMALSPKFQAGIKLQNQSAEAGVGPFALANAFHGICQAAHLKMKTKFDYGVTSTGGFVRLDRVVGKDMVHITDWFSAMIDAFVDLQKDDYILKLNVNKATIDTIELLLKLGIGIDTFHYMAQPIVKEFAKQYYLKSGRVKSSMTTDGENEYENKTAKGILRELVKNYITRYNLDTTENGALAPYLRIPFTTLLTHYSDESNALYDIDPSNAGDREVILRQVNIALQLLSMQDDAEKLTDVTLKARIDTGKLGSTPAQKAYYEVSVDKLADEHKFENLERVLRIKKTKYNKDVDTCLPTLFDNSFDLSKRLMSSVSVQNTDGFRDMFTSFVKQLPIYNRNRVALGKINSIEEEMFAYFMGRYFGMQDGPFADVKMDYNKYKELFINNGNSVFEHLLDVKGQIATEYPELADNRFLQLFKTDTRDNSPIRNYLRVPARFVTEAWDVDDYKSAYNELILHESEKVRNLAAELRLYAYYSTGNRNRLLNFSKYMSALSSQDIPFGASRLRLSDYFKSVVKQLNGNTDLAGTEGFESPISKFMPDLVREVLRNNWWDSTFVRKIKKSPEILTRYVKNNDVVGIKLTKDGSQHMVYAYNVNGRPLYERFLTIEKDGAYERWLTNEDVAGTNVLADKRPDLAVHLSGLALYEFIGVDSSTNLPIYIPVNKRSYVYKGQELHETGVYSPNDLSAIPGNNLITQISKEVRVAEINKYLAAEQDGARVIVYDKNDFRTHKLVTDRLSDAEEAKALKKVTRRKTNSTIENISINSIDAINANNKQLTNQYIDTIQSAEFSDGIKQTLLHSMDTGLTLFSSMKDTIHTIVIPTIPVADDMSKFDVSDITEVSIAAKLSLLTGANYSIYVPSDIINRADFKASPLYKQLYPYMFSDSAMFRNIAIANQMTDIAISKPDDDVVSIINDAYIAQENYNTTLTSTEDVINEDPLKSDDIISPSGQSSVNHPINVYIYESLADAEQQGASAAVYIDEQAYAHTIHKESILKEINKSADVFEKLPNKRLGSSTDTPSKINPWVLFEIDKVLTEFTNTGEVVAIRVTDPTLFAFAQLRPFTQRNILKYSERSATTDVFTNLTAIPMRQYPHLWDVIDSIATKAKQIQANGGEVMFMLARVPEVTSDSFIQSYNDTLEFDKSRSLTGEKVFGVKHDFSQLGLYPTEKFDIDMHDIAEKVFKQDISAYKPLTTLKADLGIDDLPDNVNLDIPEVDNSTKAEANEIGEHCSTVNK